METIEERANRMAGWILRRESMLKACNLPKLLKEMLEEQKAIDDKEYTNEMQQLNEEWKENLVIQRAMLIDKAVAWVDHNVGTLSAIALRKAMEGEK